MNEALVHLLESHWPGYSSARGNCGDSETYPSIIVIATTMEGLIE
jgi:hypothetical protein